MIKRLVTAAWLIAAFAPLPSLAQGVASAVPADRLNADQMICKTMVITGSRLGARKICQTRAQWEARSRNDRRQFDDNMQRAFSVNCTSGMSGGTGRCSG